ncbi:hypothetical protein [Sphingobium sp. MK2]
MALLRGLGLLLSKAFFIEHLIPHDSENTSLDQIMILHPIPWHSRLTTAA